jgi:uncharacterized protein (TIGR02246 family)
MPVVLLLAGLLLAVEPPTVVLPPEVERVLRDYEKGWRAKDAKALAALFVDRGWVLQSGEGFARGREAIEAKYQGQGGDLYLRAVGFERDGNLAYVIGAYTYGGADKADMGKFTLVLKRVKGKWMIVSDMDNSVGRQ